MKVLFLVIAEQRVILDRLYQAVLENCELCEIVRLSGKDQLSLAKVLVRCEYERFDRVVVFSRLKKLLPQVALLKVIPNLVILEHDACQNYMPDSKYFGQYSKLYRALPAARVIVSGVGVAARLRSEGVDAVFVPKGYDESQLCNRQSVRDIPLAFIGSTKSGAYRGRAELLAELSRRTELLIARTASGSEYSAMLNRIRVFVSADIGMGEYMIKNFEAMACGCVLLAYRQGAEDAVLGFEDGKNVLLYSDAGEALEKIVMILKYPDAARAIAAEGQRFAETRYSFSRVGAELAKAVFRPVRAVPEPSWLLRCYVNLRYGFKVLKCL